jgi:hypothetical protein
MLCTGLMLCLFNEVDKQDARVSIVPETCIRYCREGITTAIGNLASTVRSRTLHNLLMYTNNIARICG